MKAIRYRWVEQKLCRKHINQRVNRIRRIFKWGVENEMLPSSVLHAAQAVAPLKKAERSPGIKTRAPVPDEHVDAVLPKVSRQVAAMIQLQRLSGHAVGRVGHHATV